VKAHPFTVMCERFGATHRLIPEATEPTHRRPVRGRLREGHDLPLQVGDPGEELLHGPAVLLGPCARARGARTAGSGARPSGAGSSGARPGTSGRGGPGTSRADGASAGQWAWYKLLGVGEP
jgi:hypothetical protein